MTLSYNRSCNDFRTRNDYFVTEITLPVELMIADITVGEFLPADWPNYLDQRVEYFGYKLVDTVPR